MNLKLMASTILNRGALPKIKTAGHFYGGEKEYVIGMAAIYIYLVNAVYELLNGKNLKYILK
jgi:hypothetical protein